MAFVVSSLENLVAQEEAEVVSEEQAAFEIAEAATLWISETRFVLLSFQNFLFSPVCAGRRSQAKIDSFSSCPKFVVIVVVFW